MFKNPFSFDGRIRRTEYCLSILIYTVIVCIISILAQEISVALDILIVPVIWFFIAQGAKRCHDRGNSGWYQIIPFYSLWMMFAESIPGPNEYGSNPKGIGNFDEIDAIGSELN